jgi:hypothetical protein
MTALTATERGDLAEQLLPIAAKLACIAHGDGDHHDITHHTRNLNRDELVGLIAVLAGLVDPDQTISDALGYLTWDEHGRPDTPAKTGERTIRGLAAGIDGPMTLGAARIVESERVLWARRLYVHDGLSVSAVARAVGASEVTVRQWRDSGDWRQPPTITEFDAGKRRRRAA